MKKLDIRIIFFKALSWLPLVCVTTVLFVMAELVHEKPTYFHIFGFACWVFSFLNIIHSRIQSYMQKKHNDFIENLISNVVVKVQQNEPESEPTVN